MKQLLEPHVIISLAVIIGSLSMAAMTLIIVLREKISGVFVSRSGVSIHTTDLSDYSKAVDQIDRIDSDTHQAIRKATTGLMIIDPETHDMSAEVLLAILGANQPLVCATFENQHTRALKADADAYLASKALDISAAVRIVKKHFPELTDDRCNAFACHWLKKILLPNLRRACYEKAAYYKSQINRTGVSKTVKAILEECLAKNLDYIKCFDMLALRPDIAEKSSIFYTVPTK
jgi:hypothetical protein